MTEEFNLSKKIVSIEIGRREENTSYIDLLMQDFYIKTSDVKEFIKRLKEAPKGGEWEKFAGEFYRKYGKMPEDYYDNSWEVERDFSNWRIDNLTGPKLT